MNRVIIGLVAVLASFTVLHQGKTDSNGGHYDHSAGEYHYHHGYPAHDHYDMNGDGIVDCPYNFKDKTNNKGNTSNKGSTSKSESKTNNFTESSNNSVKKPSSTISFGDVFQMIILGAIYSYIAFFIILWIVYLVICAISKLTKKNFTKFSDFLQSDEFGKPLSVVVAIISIAIALIITLRENGII